MIEIGCLIAHGFRHFEHYRLRMLLISGGLNASLHTHAEDPIVRMSAITVSSMF